MVDAYPICVFPSASTILSPSRILTILVATEKASLNAEYAQASSTSPSTIWEGPKLFDSLHQTRLRHYRLPSDDVNH